MSSQLVAVFGASRVPQDDPAYREGVRCGTLLAGAGFGVVTGGYGGLMEAVSSGAHDAGGRVVGVTAPSVFPGRTGANRFVTDEQPAPTLVERIQAMLQMTAGSIALPGSIGTLTELVMAWNLAFVAGFSGATVKPLFAVGDTWERIVPALTQALETDGTLVQCVASVDDAVAGIAARLSPGQSLHPNHTFDHTVGEDETHE